MGELIDSAYVFIKREQYDRALILLKKAYGLSEVVPEFTNQCRRDKYYLFVMFHNMALCYQNQSLLEESASCMNLAIECFPIEAIVDIEDRSCIANRMRKLSMLAQLKLQFCATLS
jgi:hypothetical protein